MGLKPNIPAICLSLVLSALPLWCHGDQSTLTSPFSPYAKARPWGQIIDSRINEASGMAMSGINENCIWIINDSGNSNLLYGVSPRGRVKNVFRIQGAKNRDWEDLACFSIKGQPYLMIGDMGDNRAKRDFCMLYVVPEPNLSKGDPREIQTIPFAWQIRYKYQDGPRDCEALAVDERGNRVLLLTKRDIPPVLYGLELKKTRANEQAVAKPIAHISNIPSPTKEDLKNKYGRYYSQPTAMDLKDKGNTLVILTYKHAYLYAKTPGMSWKEAFLSFPATIALPHPATGQLLIRESLCIDPYTQDIFITSERVPAPIYRLPWNTFN